MGDSVYLSPNPQALGEWRDMEDTLEEGHNKTGGTWRGAAYYEGWLGMQKYMSVTLNFVKQLIKTLISKLTAGKKL